MTLREVLLSTLLLAAGIQAAVDDRLYPLTPRSQKAQAKRQVQTPNSMVNVHVVQVGDMDGGLKFYPDNLDVGMGEMVQFQFYPRNHSVVQSTFDRPCEPISRYRPNVAGIRSGFMPVAPGSSDMPVFTIMVNSTEPMWFYCGQGRHCQNGMVLAINAVAGSNRTIRQYRALAARAGGGNSTNPTNTIPNGPDVTGSPSESTENAAPRNIAHAAGLGGMLLAVAAIVGF